MTIFALIGRADDPRACRGVIRATLLTLPLVVFVTLALVPMSANIGNSGICVHRCEAYADATPTPYAQDFLDAAASQSGLSGNNFIASVAGALATGTGVLIANSSGILFNEAGIDDNLNNLVEAADYPEWSSLSEEQQQAWGSASNYNSAKFNALMDAFGLEGERDRYYASGGGNFEFSQDGKDKLAQLGRIGSNWANNIGVSIENIKNAITNRSAISGWFPVGNPGGLVFDGSEVAGYPSYLPTQLNYSVDVTNVYLSYKDNKNVFYVEEYASNIPVYCCAFNSQGNRWIVQFFSKGTFKTGAGSTQAKSPATTLNATQATYNGHVYYYRQYTQILSNGQTEAQISGVAINVTEQSPVANFPYMEMILYSEQESEPVGGGEEEVPGYPEEVPQDTIVYYPAEGINPNVTWDNYIEPQRPTNEYNPGDQTGKQDWRQETSQNVMPLQNIKFDKLFPFCLLTDVKDLSEKIDNTITPGQQSNYMKVNIPMAYADDGSGGLRQEDIELDGEPLYDLLVMVKPFSQIMLLFFLVFSLVMFWKSILTGD